VASIEIRPELYNSWQYAHGGVVMTLLDVTMGSAARSSVPHAAGVVTVDMSVSFIAAGQGRTDGGGTGAAQRRLDHFLRRRDARRGRRAGGEGDGLLQGETQSQSRRHGGSDCRPRRSGERDGERVVRRTLPSPASAGRKPRYEKTNKQIVLASRPTAGSRKVELQAGRGRRHAGDRRRPGAGAQPLALARPLHARPHERRQVLRRPGRTSAT
jgi:hypothetical protein